jgi:hypothetical protein
LEFCENRLRPRLDPTSFLQQSQSTNSSGEISSGSESTSRRAVLARPRLRPARGIRQFDSAERGAAGFSGLANGGTEILMRGNCLGAVSILRLLFHIDWFAGSQNTTEKCFCGIWNARIHRSTQEAKEGFRTSGLAADATEACPHAVSTQPKHIFLEPLLERLFGLEISRALCLVKFQG